MGLPQFRTCCCGCTLRTGTLILLWLYIIGCIMNFLIFSTIPSKVLGKTGSFSGLEVLAYGLVFLIVGIITAIGVAGLYGVYKDRHSYLIPYLSWTGSLLVLQTIGLLVYAIFLPLQAPENEMSDALAASAGLLISAFLGFAFNGYFWLVVYNYYRVLKEGSTSEDIV